MQPKYVPQFSKRSNRLATRARILYFGIPSLAVAVLLVIFSLILQELANDSARRLARQYAIEAAANFLASTNQHFVLMQQISRSTTISRWLADENNHVNKALAFDEIMGYATSAPNVYLMFTAYASLQGYNFDIGLTLEEFAPWGRIIDYGQEASQWFFDTRDAEKSFVLNIQRTRADYALYVWSNNRMYYRGYFVGVVTVGSPFAGVFDATFGGFDINYRRGYIIDRNRAVRVDSAELLEVTLYGLPTFPAMPEAAANPALATLINCLQQRISGGFFQPGTIPCDAVRLEREATYRYGSVAPIIGTDWSVVVLANYEGFFTGTSLIPLVFSAFAVLVLSVIIGNLLMRRIAFDPLFKLTQSLAEPAVVAEKAALFGLDRKDEIGDLSRTIQFMRNSLNFSHITLKHRENLLDMGNIVSEMLLAASKGADNFVFKKALSQSLEIIGLRMEVDRVQLWRANVYAGRMTTILDCQWLSELGEKLPQADVSKRVPVEALPKWETLFLHNKPFNCPVSELAPEDRELMDPHGTLKSVVIIPVFLHDQFWGFFSIDDCVKERTLSGGEMKILRSLSLMMASTYENMALAAKEQETKELNQILIDFAPYVIGQWDDKGKIKVINPQAMEFFGVTDPEIVVDDILAYSPEFQPCGTSTPVKAAMLLERAYREGAIRFEWLHKRTDGELVPAECFYKTFKHKGKDLLLSYTSDLRAIKAAEAKHREANEVVNMLLDASPMFIEIWDDNLNLIDCNNRVMNMFGVQNKAEFIAKYETLSPVHQPCGTPSKEKHITLYEQALREAYAKSEWMHLTATGEELPVEVIYVRLPRQDRHIVVVYNHDLREVKKAMAEMQRIEIAEESNKAKSKFLAKMSHEIRTPITAVLGISEIQLHNTSLPLDIEESFAKIYNSANTLLGIVNDILDLSKVEAGKMEIINAKYKVTSLVSDIVQLNLAYLGSKKLNFDIDVDKDIPTVLVGDVLRIKQSMNNMLSNAFKYTDEGSVKMKMYTKNGDQEGNVNLVVVVQDTGRGMSKKQLKALFDEYSRFHDKEHRFETGTGLGMSITYALLRMMNATIDVSSEVGKGTTVTIVIPQEVGSKKTLGAEQVRNFKNFNIDTQSAIKRLSFAPEPMPYGRVLVVDDVDANIYVITGLLNLYELQIDTCSSGIAAIEKVKSGEVYDIIFMDQMMPEMNGMEAAAIIRKTNYNHPIIALTADAFVGQAEKYLNNGFDGFLSKPIQTAHLNALLHKFVREAHPEAAEAARDETDYAFAKEMPLNREANAKQQGASDYFNNFMETSGINDKIRKDILRNRRNVIREVTDAIEANDLETASRLVHTLKGLVGSIGEKRLFDLADRTERSFRKGVVSTDLIDALDLEMECVLARIRQNLKETEEPQTEAALDKDRAKEVFDELTQLLKTNSFDAIELCGDLAQIPQTKDLINQIETVDFSLALKTLKDIREVLKV